MCAGVVKAKPLLNKNPGQHFADMLMIQEKEEIKPVFTNYQTGKDKEIECIRVDGGADEGQVHEEVQYWWAKRAQRRLWFPQEAVAPVLKIGLNFKTDVWP